VDAVRRDVVQHYDAIIISVRGHNLRFTASCHDPPSANGFNNAVLCPNTKLSKRTAVKSHSFTVTITSTVYSRVSMALIRLCDSVCLSVCLHDKTKTAETKITGIVHHDTLPTMNIRSEVKGQG